MEAAILKQILKMKNIKLNLFLKNNHNHTHLTNVTFTYYANNHFMEVFLNIILYLDITGKNQYPLWVSDVTTSLICWFLPWHF